MELTQSDYEDRKSRVDAGTGDDEDARLVKHYERQGFTWDGNRTETSSDTTPNKRKRSVRQSLSTAPTTSRPSSKDRTESSTVPSTGGSGPTSESSGASE
jgi:hypothetical protein